MSISSRCCTDFGYASLKRVEKGVVRRYLMHTTGYSRQQVTRLVRQYRSRGCLRKNYQTPAHGFARKFTAADRGLLAETDRVHGTLSGPATKRLLQRAFGVFGDRR